MIIDGKRYPNWTVIGNTGDPTDSAEGWRGVQYHFTNEESFASMIYEILGTHAIVKRPFDKADIPFLRGGRYEIVS